MESLKWVILISVVAVTSNRESPYMVISCFALWIQTLHSGRKPVQFLSEDFIPKECDSSSIPCTSNEPLLPCWLGFLDAVISPFLPWRRQDIYLNSSLKLEQTPRRADKIATTSFIGLCRTSVFDTMSSLSASYSVNTGEKGLSRRAVDWKMKVICEWKWHRKQFW